MPSRLPTELTQCMYRVLMSLKGLIDGKAEADYETCVDICTKSSLKEMIFPAALGILAPIIVGLVLGCNGVVGMLAGALYRGLLLPFCMPKTAPYRRMWR